MSSPNNELTVADPAPLGLAAFALTTFLLSAANAGLTNKGGGNEWIGYAFFYGGLGQLLAGMWEFKRQNVFGATAFSTYGGFWLGLGYYIQHVAATSKDVNNDLGWILLAFAIFNTYMLLWSATLNIAVFAVFLTLEVTEIVLFIGFLGGNANIVKIGGYVGILTALCAWYTSAAGVGAGMGRTLLPVGGPLWRENSSATV